MSLTRRPRRPVAALTSAFALSLALLAGCSASSDEGADLPAEVLADGMADDAGDGSGEDTPDGAGDEAAADGSSVEGEQAGQVTQGAAEGRMIARDATLTVSVEDVGPAAAQVRAAAVAADGWVVSEQLEPDAGPDTYDGYAVVVISVPSTALDSTLADLGPVGRVTGSTMTSEDVTTQHADATARIETLEASITRLRGLMEDATGIEDIVSLERELAQREADLDALQGVAETLENDVARSTITVTLSEADPAAPLSEPAEARTGFVAGLENGWRAFLGGVTFVLTALGALLPFAIVAALVAAPVLWWRRRRRPTGATTSDPVRVNSQH